jgi:hypothetical protein
VENDAAVVGLVGTLTIGTRGSRGPGEVLIKIRGGSEAYLAWSNDPLDKGTRVLVVDARGARTVEVVTWSDSSQPRTHPTTHTLE